jgi:UDP-2,4-diacetamido-2,4,6-trideoxy-beta-L-altropyranose hydrolase
MPMSPTRVYFRVDADPRIGSGHLVRCRLLADGLRRRAVPSGFLTSTTPEFLCESLAAAGHKVASLSAEQSIDPRHFSDEIQRAGDGPAMLVLDSESPEFYETQWHETIRAQGIRLMIITFRHDCHFAADLVHNQNLLALHRQYSVEAHTELLLGPRYAVLAEEYRGLHEMPLRMRDQPRTILLTFGGADRHDLTARAVRALSELRAPPERLLVVAGSLYGRISALEALLSEHGRMHPELHVDTRRMAALMAEADLALSSGGLTAWELACAGVPNVIISSSDRERQTARLLQQEELACFVGHHDQASLEEITDAIERLMADPARLRSYALAGRKLVDGRGLDRVLDRMLAP